MTDTPPNRLSINPESPHYDAALLERGVGVRFKGADKQNVDEYCVSAILCKALRHLSRHRHCIDNAPLSSKLDWSN